MDPINILVGVNLLASMGANLSGAKKGLKQSLKTTINKPETYLQKTPPNVAAVILLLQFLAVFGIGVYSPDNINEFDTIRMIGLAVFVAFSWMQVWAYKHMGDTYSQDIVITKNSRLVTDGPYKTIRHPQYLFQILSDLGAGIALFGFVIVPVVILAEIPLFILRARFEDKLLEEHFKEKFVTYKKSSGFFFPFIG